MVAAAVIVVVVEAGVLAEELPLVVDRVLVPVEVEPEVVALDFPEVDIVAVEPDAEAEAELDCEATVFDDSTTNCGV